MIGLALATLLAPATPAQAKTIVPTTYYRTFSHAHPVLARIRPGEAVATRTLDSGGQDERGEKRSEPFNPLNGPFHVEGAEPGDALAVRITKLALNRDWGWSAYRLGLFALTPEHVEHVYSAEYKADLIRKGRSNLVPWDIDLKRQTVRLREPTSKAIALEFPARPMLGCIGVAPAGDFAPTSGPSGSYGGNLDYNKIGEGATVYLPVYHPGGLLFIGDGHALQADGEPTGTGIETSVDVEFVVEVKKGAKLAGPRVETAEEIISIGSQPEFASALDNGLKMATSDMADWLAKDYGLEPWAAHLLIGYQGHYDVVTVAGSMALRVPKARLPERKTASAPAKDDAKTEAEPARPKGPPTMAEKTAGLKKIDGLFPLYWDEAAGRLFMEVTQFDREFLYQVGLATGVGSNPIGLDRGQLGRTHVVVFRRVGPKVLMVEPNYRYRALGAGSAERRAVEESFAQSVLAGFKVEAADEGRALVDATAFFLRDAHGVADRIRLAGQGRFRLDPDRSALRLERTRGFPKNTEVEALLAFAADDEPGPLVAASAPSAKAVAVHQHHSLVELPPLDDGYKPRRLDPRVGVFGIDFADFATPVGKPIETRWINRFRLRKKDPKAATSEPEASIVYYVDPGAPGPIRAALIEGASWWKAAFEAAGFRDAFRVEILPDDADPMDLRYNVIQWVHRSTRGWSYGRSVVDPRTGEILKGAVTLDSLRARQDALIGDGLAPASAGVQGCDMAMPPGPEYLAAADPAADVGAMVLSRLRQLSAHEVGHTLGLAHNFAASTYGRASVMDYPAPLVKVRDGALDLSDAYAKGIGAYDRFAIKYAYAQFAPEADESAELDRIVRDGVAAGMLFLSDADARPDGAAHPLASLWDNGADPVEALRHELEVRRIGLAKFGLGNLADGEPLATLEARLLPLYLHHRYQLRAAAKSLGGAYYTNAVKAGSSPVPARVLEIVPASRQREALTAVLATIEPKALVLPGRILDLIPPEAFGHDGGTAELFGKRTGPVFDPIAAATVAADLAVSALLQPQRAARLEAFHARDSANPDLAEVVTALLDRTWRAEPPDDGQEAAVLRAVQSLVLTRLIDLAGDPAATPQVRAEATHALRGLSADLAGGLSVADVAHRRSARDEIERFLARPDATHRRERPQPAPPGDPIGERAR
jgi:acetamidase/formamidase